MSSHQAKLVCRFKIRDVMPATAISRAISMMEMKTRYCGDSSVLVLGSVVLIVNCTTKVGTSTEIRVFNRSAKSLLVMRKQVKPMRVNTIGGIIVWRVKNSLRERCHLR